MTKMEAGLGTTAYNMSLSLPDMCHLNGWLDEWNPHVVEIAPRVEVKMTRGMMKNGQLNAGLQSMMIDAME
jgi:hypothetical protein